MVVTIPAGHELAGLFIPYTTPYLLMAKAQPPAKQRHFMTTLSSVPICVDVEPVSDPKYGVDPIPTLVPGLIATLFFVNKKGDSSYVAGTVY